MEGWKLGEMIGSYGHKKALRLMNEKYVQRQWSFMFENARWKHQRYTCDAIEVDLPSLKTKFFTQN